MRRYVLILGKYLSVIITILGKYLSMIITILGKYLSMIITIAVVVVLSQRLLYGCDLF